MKVFTHALRKSLAYTRGSHIFLEGFHIPITWGSSPPCRTRTLHRMPLASAALGVSRPPWKVSTPATSAPLGAESRRHGSAKTGADGRYPLGFAQGAGAYLMRSTSSPVRDSGIQRRSVSPLLSRQEPVKKRKKRAVALPRPGKLKRGGGANSRPSDAILEAFAGMCPILLPKPIAAIRLSQSFSNMTAGSKQGIRHVSGRPCR